ncbi:uncharacterized protein RAG0_09335 [Rhynchosporium agropyri]|uniref:Uncharacterized protein n=1 Tax=Rhynchosporium agropyri TaxID=914238 RepID=A0A1E1KV57_9HELO|nr:uncharacterized protein RAG0_09335 [Rhynchosporium agropyri]
MILRWRGLQYLTFHSTDVWPIATVPLYGAHLQNHSSCCTS